MNDTLKSGAIESIVRAWDGGGASALFKLSGKADPSLLGGSVKITAISSGTEVPIFFGEIVKVLGEGGLFTRYMALSRWARIRNKHVSVIVDGTNVYDDCTLAEAILSQALTGEDSSLVTYVIQSGCSDNAISLVKGENWEGKAGDLLDRLSAQTGKKIKVRFRNGLEEVVWSWEIDNSSTLSFTSGFLIGKRERDASNIINHAIVRVKREAQMDEEFLSHDPNTPIELTYRPRGRNDLEVYWKDPSGNYVQLCKYEDYSVDGKTITITATDVINAGVSDFRVHYVYDDYAVYEASDTTSITNYGERAEVITLENVDEAVAQSIANGVVASRKDPIESYEIKLYPNSSGYNLTGELGVKASFTIDGVSKALTITKIRWEKGFRILEVGKILPTVGEIIAGIKRQMLSGVVGATSETSPSPFWEPPSAV